MLLTYYGIPPDFRGGVHLFAIAYRWRSLPRVRRYRASKPQGSSERILPWQVIVDQLICASLSHTNYWYEMGMLKVQVHATDSVKTEYLWMYTC